MALHSSGFASFYIGYCLVGSVCLHLFEIADVCLNLLSTTICLICSRPSLYICDSVLCTCLICSRSSSYLCDSVLCTCLIYSLSISVRTSLLLNLNMYVCCSSSTSVRISSPNLYLSAALFPTSVRTSLLNLHLSASLRLPLFRCL
ncbi:hypothetical protein Tco_1010451 [Tanacetum coccineum]